MHRALLPLWALVTSASGSRVTASVHEADANGLDPRRVVLATTAPAWCAALVAPRSSGTRRALGVDSPPRVTTPMLATAGRSYRTSLDSTVPFKDADLEYLHLLETGRGHDVWHARLSGKDFATNVRLKIIPGDLWNTRAVVRERSITEKFGDGKFLKFVAAWNQGPAGYIATEVHGDNLEHAVGRKKFEIIDITTRMIFIMDLLDGLADMAQEGFCHTNVSPLNVFVSTVQKPRLKIGGLLRAFRWRRPRMPWNRRWRLSSHERGEAMGLTCPYVPPEMLQTRSVDSSADVFSTGMIMYELLFEGVQPKKFYEAQAQKSKAGAAEVWREFDMNADKVLARAIADSADAHPWLQQVLLLVAAMGRQRPEERIDIRHARSTLRQLLDKPMSPSDEAAAQAILRRAKDSVTALCNPR